MTSDYDFKVFIYSSSLLEYKIYDLPDFQRYLTSRLEIESIRLSSDCTESGTMMYDWSSETAKRM